MQVHTGETIFIKPGMLRARTEPNLWINRPPTAYRVGLGSSGFGWTKLHRTIAGCDRLNAVAIALPQPAAKEPPTLVACEYFELRRSKGHCRFSQILKKDRFMRGCNPGPGA
jgi:hypothetical protein